jgi:tetrathionate reductase subunit C
MNTTVEIIGLAREPGWLSWAVQYFFLIGISIAAFFLALPGLIWRRPAWRGLARRALLAALVFGYAAPVALLADLHQPGRFMNFYLHANFGSWMAWGSYFIPIYLGGLTAFALAVLLSRDRPHAAAVGWSAAVTAVGAVLVLLYTGMEVMVVAARPLWHTPLLPLLFAATAFTGGLGTIQAFEALAGKTDSAQLLNRWMRFGQWTFLALLGLWLVLAAFGISATAAEALTTLRGGWTVAWIWLAISIALTLWAARGQSLWLPALLALQGAWLLRWLVFMGGQSVPKLGAAFHAQVLQLTPDSLLGMLGMAGLCLAIYIVLTGLVRWDEPTEA